MTAFSRTTNELASGRSGSKVSTMVIYFKFSRIYGVIKNLGNDRITGFQEVHFVFHKPLVSFFFFSFCIFIFHSCLVDTVREPEYYL